MYQVAYGPLAAAVSNAGGLGVIGSAYMPPTRLREEIRIAKAETDKPFGVDILFAKTAGGGATVEAYEREVQSPHRRDVRGRTYQSSSRALAIRVRSYPRPTQRA